MPKTLNPNNNFPTSITNFPISGNNEPIAIEPLEAAIQAVLDRTENLHQSRLTVEGVGVKRIRQFASRSALSAASGFADGDIVSVDGYGLYRLFTSSGAAADGLWVLTATGGGRWIHIENNLKGSSDGLATLNSANRLAQDVRDGSIATAHIANGAVTSAKLASGAVVGHLGYTPLNKAGDIMSGALVVAPNAGETMGVKGGTSDHAYIAFYARSNSQHIRSAHIGFTWAGSTTFSIVNEAGTVVAIPHELKSRYNHAERFVFSSSVGSSVAIPAGAESNVARFTVNIPSGKLLYLRRARFFINNTGLQLRVISGAGTYTSSSSSDDVTPNTLIGAGGSQVVTIRVYNPSGTSQTLLSDSAYWLELEID